MTMRAGVALTLLAAGLGGFTGCSAATPAKPTAPAAIAEASPAAPYDTPVPTVAPRVATPAAKGAATSEPEKKAPEPKEAAAGSGPEITFFGVARADGMLAKPASATGGIPTYNSAAGSGFILVVEAKPGKSGVDPGRQVFLHSENDPNLRPDLEIISNRDLGDGSEAVCDRRKPVIGGIPGVNPPTFATTQTVANAINDLSCRFETFIESESSCTLDKLGNFSFGSPKTTTQFCVIVARAFQFPVGTTELQVRVRDTAGTPGPIKKLRIVRAEPKVKLGDKPASSLPALSNEPIKK